MTRRVKWKLLLVAAAFCLGSLAGTPLRQKEAAASTASSAAVQHKKTTRRNNARFDAAQAKTLYEQNCARCHGADGRGKTPLGEMQGAPDLTDAKGLKGASDKRLATSIARGRGGMPSFSKKLSPEEIATLVRFVRTFKN